MCGGFKYTLPIFPALVVTVPVPILFFCSSNNIYNKIYNNIMRVFALCRNEGIPYDRHRVHGPDGSARRVERVSRLAIGGRRDVCWKFFDER